MKKFLKELMKFLEGVKTLQVETSPVFVVKIDHKEVAASLEVSEETTYAGKMQYRMVYTVTEK